MGKNGFLLRQKKAQNVKYTFTSEQLEAHDRLLLKNYRDKVANETKKQIKDYEAQVMAKVDEEWKSREAMLNNTDEEEKFFLILQYLLSVSVRVLVEKFHWTPCPNNRTDNRYRLQKFADHMADEIANICSNELEDIRDYCDTTFKKYGIRFLMQSYED